MSVTPMAEMRNMGVRATWIRCAISTAWVVTAELSTRLPLDALRPPSPGNRNAPAALQRPGRQPSKYYLVVEGAVVVAAAFFFLWCFFFAFGASVVVVPDAAGASADIGAAVFGISAAIAPAARPIVNKAETIKVPDLFIATPTVGINMRMGEYAGSTDLSADEDHFTKA